MLDDNTPQGGLGQDWFVLDFEAAYAGGGVVEPAPASDPGEGGFYGPIGRRVEFRAPVRGALTRSFQTRVPFSSDKIRTFSATAPIQGRGARRIEVLQPVVREEATVYAQAIKEDDELMLIFASM